jgi:paraquat-inducible protein B
MPDTADDPVLAPAVTPKKSRFSWIWLVPLVAALAGASLVVRTWMESGPRITIAFNTAAGLEVGQTQVRYKDVVVGVVNGIRLSDDWSKVIVTADITRNAENLAREGTRFWVVRPRLALSGVSGLGTLLSGAYIAVDTPSATPDDDRVEQRDFAGLEEPPEIPRDRPGRRFTLRAADLGSLDIGSPVYYRRINVGRIVGYDLDESGRAVNIQVFIEAPHDRFVTQGTRFWNASGIDVTLGADGLKVHSQSMVSLLLGGIAFDPVDPNAEPAAADSVFTLYGGEDQARATPDGIPLPIRMRFSQSVRGLSVGAPIDFKGINLGEVTSIRMDYDSEERQFFLWVDANLYPQRLGPVFDRLQALPAPGNEPVEAIVPMIEHGLRAQLRTANLLTGQLYVVLDFVPDTDKVVVEKTRPVLVPTIPGEFDQLQQQLGRIITKIEKLPLEEIGTGLNTTIANAASLISRLDKQVAPQAQGMLRQATRSLAQISELLSSDSGLPTSTERAMQELTRAARSLRVLADYLQANPEALLRGRSPDALPNVAP